MPVRGDGVFVGDVHDVAACILARTAPISAVKLQRLCFYSQAWSLAWEDRPLFGQRIEAWVNGPVVRELYAQYGERWSGDPSRLDAGQLSTIETVLAAYGQLTSQQLGGLARSERPWIEARERGPSVERSRSEISHESMRSFYASLMSDRCDNLGP